MNTRGIFFSGFVFAAGFFSFAFPVDAASEWSQIASCESQTLTLDVYASSSKQSDGWVEIGGPRGFQNVLIPAAVVEGHDQIQVRPLQGFESFALQRGVNTSVDLCQQGCPLGPATLLCLVETRNKHYPSEPFAEPEAHPAESAAAQRLEKLGFSCEADGTVAGPVTSCIGHLPNPQDAGRAYPLEVAVLIPPQYAPREKPGLMIHLMGYNQPRWIETLDFTRWFAPRSLRYKLHETHFREFEQLALSRRNEIMIVPHTQLECYDYDKNLANPQGFDRFISASAQLLFKAGLIPSADVGNIVIAGQSGSFRTTAAILNFKDSHYAPSVKEVYLFDSLFGRMDGFYRWIAASPDHRFWSGYIKNWSEEGNARVEDKLKAAHISFFQGPAQAVTPEVLRQNRIGFYEAEPGQTHLTIFARYFAKIVGFQNS